jgi:hypothetical protein
MSDITPTKQIEELRTSIKKEGQLKKLPVLEAFGAPSATASPSTPTPTDLDKILGKHSVHFNYNKAETRTQLEAYIQAEIVKAREIFIPVKGAEGHYEVSNTGKVRSVLGGRRRGVELKQQTYVSTTNRGYKTVSLVKKGKTMTAIVHRLVAQSFISNPLNKPCVNHKDGNKMNNDVTNLEWVTHSENELHAYSELGKVNPNDPSRLTALKEGLKGESNA